MRLAISKKADLVALPNTLAMFLVGLPFLSYAFEGPIRYWLLQRDALAILYLRDLMLVGAIAVLSLARGFRIHFVITLVAIVVAASMGIGLLNGLGTLQVVVGAKIFLPLVAGMTVGSHCWKQLWESTTTLRKLILLVVVAGIVADRFSAMPWENLESASLSVGNVDVTNIEHRRTWRTHGVERCAGFSRASYDAAAILMVLLACEAGATKVLTLGTLTLASLAGVFLTTTKGVILALVSNVAWLPISASRIGRSMKFLPLVVGLLGILLSATVPIIAIMSGGFQRNQENSVLFGSLADRSSETWPRAMELLDGPAQLLFGRGVGGIGVAQKFSEAEQFVAPDNLFLSLLVQFGIPVAIAVYAVLTILIVKAYRSDSSNDFPLAALSLIGIYGITTSVLESPVLALAMGLAVGSLLASAPSTATSYPQQSQAVEPQALSAGT